MVSNQNLHGAETPTMVIITPKEFAAQAERVAELHRTVDGFKVIVVDDRSVYNEFSSGTPDAMAYRKLARDDVSIPINPPCSLRYINSPPDTSAASQRVNSQVPV